jgi:hypothetical protein
MTLDAKLLARVTGADKLWLLGTPCCTGRHVMYLHALL